MFIEKELKGIDGVGDTVRIDIMARNYLSNIFHNIKNRCLNKECLGYDSYGGRGITIHQEWVDDCHLFYKWIVENIGERPDKSFSLDRINNNGNYEPGNLRWATPSEQALNRRASKSTCNVIYEGERMSQSQLARKLGMSRQRVNQIKNRGSDKYTIAFL